MRDEEPRLVGCRTVGYLEVSVVKDGRVMVVATAVVVAILNGSRV
jgi:hypothetical protein